MRCKCCDSKFKPEDWRINPMSGDYDDFCIKCSRKQKEYLSGTVQQNSGTDKGMCKSLNGDDSKDKSR